MGLKPVFVSHDAPVTNSDEDMISLTGVYDRLWMVYGKRFCSRELTIETHLTARERIFLLRLARRCKGFTYVEIGSYIGASACFIARGILLAKKPVTTKLYCVDTWMNDAMTEGQRDTYHQFIKNTEQYSDVISIQRGLSNDVAESLQCMIDFLFIDGDHSYEGVCNDINAWFPKLSPCATVVFHDYGWAEGVRRAVREHVLPIEAYPGETLDNMYWAVLRK